MVSFSNIDILIIILFFAGILLTGFWTGRKTSGDDEDYLLSGRKLGLLLFVLTNVSTWYGGILGVGEFTYRYGIASWFTQGFPYYIFAIIFALLFAKKIREATLYTIPDKIEATYGKTAGAISAILIFILVSPAPYLLMLANLISLIFEIKIFWALTVSIILSSAYLFKGGYRSDIYTDVVEFGVMFIGFILVFIISVVNHGGFEFLESNLPETHLSFTGGTSIAFITVWFLIALWTFADPGFHQRCYAAKNGDVAKKGIIISVVLWAAFDFLTTTTGLFSKAVLPEIDNPVMAFPLYAEQLLGPGLKGIFYAALFATILSTLNSFLFLSATTFGHDLLKKIRKKKESSGTINTRIGLIISSILAIILGLSFDSIIQMWYTIGSICIPGLIILITSAYYPKFKVSNKFAVAELISASLISFTWWQIRSYFEIEFLEILEPMLVGLIVAILIHLIGLNRRSLRLPPN